MDIALIIIASVFMIAGIIDCIIPVLPGPPLSYVGMLLLQLLKTPPFSNKYLIVWLIIVLVVSVLDYLIPVYGTKKFGGTRYGIWGCAIGLVIGLWFGPIGIIVGPFLGAFVGELFASSAADKAFRAALGSFIGFLFSTLLKLTTCFVMTWYFIQALL